MHRNRLVALPARLALNNLFSYAGFPSSSFPQQLIPAPQEPGPVETTESIVGTWLEWNGRMSVA